MESRIPLASDIKGISSLDLELAFRYSHYSDFGVSTTPKVATLYRPVEKLLLRATFSKGFRAPNLGELHKGKQKSYVFLVDPCSLSNSPDKYLGCEVQSDPTQIQFLTTFAGEPGLKPEEAINNTLGIVWGSVVNGVSASVDYFRIRQQNVVDANVQYILDQNAKFGSFPDLVQRDDNGNIEQIYAPFINIGRRKINGVDFGLKWNGIHGLGGKWTWSINASYLDKFLDQVDPESPKEDISDTFVDAASAGNGALPRWKANSGILFEGKRFRLSYSVKYISSLHEYVPFTDRRRKISPWLTHDLQVGYQFPHFGNTVWIFGVDNVFDRPPPLVTSAFNDSYDARSYDISGRFVYSKFSFRF